MKKPEKITHNSIKTDIFQHNNMGELIFNLEQQYGKSLSLGQLKSVELHEINAPWSEEHSYAQFNLPSTENPNYEQELKDYNRYIEIENAKKIVSKNTDSFISSLEQMAKTARQDVEAAKKKLIELGEEV